MTIASSGITARFGPRPLLPTKASPRRSLLAPLLLCLALGPPAHAQKPNPITVHLDPASTQIRWTLNATIHTVHGTFKLKDGHMTADPDTGKATGLIVIDATSGDSADAARDKRMHSAILESDKYPEISFRPNHIDGKIDLTVPGTVTVTGVFSLHGQDHPLQLTINLQPRPSAVALTTHFAIPFVAWGLKDPSTFIFRTDKEVTLDIDAIGTFQR